MITGKKYINDAVFYTVFKRHYCPTCANKLIRVKKSRIVHSKSPEAKYFDFSTGDGFLVGDVKFIWKDFYCVKCTREFRVDELKRLEVAQKKLK